MFSRNDVSGGCVISESKADTEGQTGSVGRCLTCGADSLFGHFFNGFSSSGVAFVKLSQRSLEGEIKIYYYF
jgi:hypothetical protein